MKKKVIVFDFKSITPIATYDAFYRSLEQIYDVTYYGPGYIPHDLLESDFESVYNKLGPFDLAFMHRTVQIFITKSKSIKKNDFVHYLFNTDDFSKSYPNFGEGYDRLPCPLILVSMLVDLYTLPEWYFAELAEFPGYLMLPPPQCTTSIYDMPFLHKESFYYRCDNRYYHFNKLFKDKVLPVGHLICDDEFTKPEVQLDAVNIPGVLYYYRRMALQELQRHKVRCFNKNLRQKFIELLHKSRLASYSSPMMQRIFSSLFVYNISRSKLCYTDGSRLRIFIRKFIEIPAHGSLLMGDLFHDSTNFGFVSGENCIQCHPKELPDVVNHLYQNPDEMEMIRNAGQEMVKSNFSSSAFAAQAQPVFERIANGTFAGASWQRGKLMTIE